MKRQHLGILVVLVLAIIASPVLAGDCILLKSGKYHQPGPQNGNRPPNRNDFDTSIYVVQSENYDKLIYSMKIKGGKAAKQTMDISKVDTVHYWPKPTAYTAAANLMNSGDYAGAIARFLAVAKDRSQRSWARTYALMNIALMYEDDGNLDGAIQAWEKLAKDFSRSRYVPKAFIQVGLAQLSKGDAEAAKRSFERLGRLSGLPEGQKIMAKYYMILIKEKQGAAAKNQSLLRQALSEYKALLGKTEGDTELAEVAILCRLGIGTCQLLLGQYDQALAFFQKIADAAKDPAVLAGAFIGLGDCYFKKNQWKDALLAFLRVEILYDRNPEMTAQALYKSGKCFQFMLGDGIGEDNKIRAKTQYGKCASKFPGSSWGRLSKEAIPTVR